MAGVARGTGRFRLCALRLFPHPLSAHHMAWQGCRIPADGGHCSALAPQPGSGPECSCVLHGQFPLRRGRHRHPLCAPGGLRGPRHGGCSQPPGFFDQPRQPQPHRGVSCRLGGDSTLGAPLADAGMVASDSVHRARGGRRQGGGVHRTAGYRQPALRSHLTPAGLSGGGGSARACLAARAGRRGDGAMAGGAQPRGRCSVASPPCCRAVPRGGRDATGDGGGTAGRGPHHLRRALGSRRTVPARAPSERPVARPPLSSDSAYRSHHGR